MKRDNECGADGRKGKKCEARRGVKGKREDKSIAKLKEWAA